MSARDDMARLLQQWLQLTRAESEAIQAAAWPKLQELHSHKASLRQPLDQALAKWKTQESSAFPAAVSDHPFRAEVSRLIALESHNAQLLAARRQKAREQQLLLERAAHNLRKVRRSYAPPPAVVWNSWS
jgi:hypothetical protein